MSHRFLNGPRIAGEFDVPHDSADGGWGTGQVNCSSERARRGAIDRYYDLRERSLTFRFLEEPNGRFGIPFCAATQGTTPVPFVRDNRRAPPHRVREHVPADALRACDVHGVARPRARAD